MDELKSAREIAEERAGRLGRLSAEEREEQERQRYNQIGQMLAQRWLDSARRMDLSAELGKQSEEDRHMVKQAVIERLGEAIDLTAGGSTGAANRAIQGISSAAPELQPKAEELSALIREYEEGERKLRQRLQDEFRETLHRLRISGTAIGDINIEANPQWQSASRRLADGFAPRLSLLKRSLTSLPQP